jgi:hypothetical protein
MCSFWLVERILARSGIFSTLIFYYFILIIMGILAHLSAALVDLATQYDIMLPIAPGSASPCGNGSRHRNAKALDARLTTKESVERRPEGLGLGGTDVEPDDLAPAIALGDDRDYRGDRPDAAALALSTPWRSKTAALRLALRRSLGSTLNCGYLFCGLSVSKLHNRIAACRRVRCPPARRSISYGCARQRIEKIGYGLTADDDIAGLTDPGHIYGRPGHLRAQHLSRRCFQCA